MAREIDGQAGNESRFYTSCDSPCLARWYNQHFDIFYLKKQFILVFLNYASINTNINKKSAYGL